MRIKNNGGAAIYVIIALAIAAAGGWWWYSATQVAAGATAGGAPGNATKGGGGAPVSVTTTLVKNQDLPISVTSNGTVVALQAVDIRPQVSSTLKAIHFHEGGTVKQGDLLFTMDNRTEDASQKRAEAQVLKSRADYANAERNLKRQRDLFDQKFISAAGLDVAINQAELAKGQLAVDEASAEVASVARSLTEIRAPFPGRAGAISVRIGSLVQPTATSAPLVTISQIDPIAVSFSIPERERQYVQRALAQGEVLVTAEIPGVTPQKLTGKLSFIESTIDTASGTIPMKATFTNPKFVLWPGMFVNVTVPTRTIADAAVVPIQAVQAGPERKFVYIVSADNKATLQPIEVIQNQDGFAAISGVPVGTKIVLEGAQNVRPNGTVVENAVGKTGKGARKAGPEDGKGTEPSKAAAPASDTPAPATAAPAANSATKKAARDAAPASK